MLWSAYLLSIDDNIDVYLRVCVTEVTAVDKYGAKEWTEGKNKTTKVKNNNKTTKKHKFDAINKKKKDPLSTLNFVYNS